MTERVLITGGAGFIGSFLADQFLRQGDEVVGLDLLDQQVHSNGRPDYLSNEIDLRLGGVRDRRALDDAPRVRRSSSTAPQQLASGSRSTAFSTISIRTSAARLHCWSRLLSVNRRPTS